VSGRGRRFANYPLRTFGSAMVTDCVRLTSPGRTPSTTLLPGQRPRTSPVPTRRVACVAGTGSAPRAAGWRLRPDRGARRYRRRTGLAPGLFDPRRRPRAVSRSGGHDRWRRPRGGCPGRGRPLSFTLLTASAVGGFTRRQPDNPRMTCASGPAPSAVSGMVGQDPPGDLAGRAARQVEHQVGILCHRSSLCLTGAVVQSGLSKRTRRLAGTLRSQ
jgi:hypothetical protein